MTYQRALVTGASRGIGAATVIELRNRGMNVHAIARPSSQLDELATATGAIIHAFDVRDTAQLTDTINEIRPDVMVNNAGVLPQFTGFAELTRDTIDASVDVNLRAALHATSAALGPMLDANRGHIFLLGSIAGRIPSPNSTVYSATKAALHMFADTLRLDLLGTAIRVTTIMPGRVETSIYDQALGGHDRVQAMLYEGTEAVRPIDVARAIGLALDTPANVDPTVIELMPTRQVYGGNQVGRDDE